MVASAMEKKKGDGLIFINCMEKLTMNAPRETLRARLRAAMDAGIDGITLAAGLHANSFKLIEDHPRFRDVKLGIIVSSVRALQIFLRRNAKLNRLPDYVVVEVRWPEDILDSGWIGPSNDLKTIVGEIIEYLKAEKLEIPLIAAGGVFTGSDAVSFMEQGVGGVQVATRFTISKECGLPDKAKQAYLSANEDDIEVNLVSPTGYPMRMLKKTPAIGIGLRPNCESYGYLLENGKCAYLDEYYRELGSRPDGKIIAVKDKICLCTHMRNYNVWTCGHYTYRLKETTRQRVTGLTNFRMQHTFSGITSSARTTKFFFPANKKTKKADIHYLPFFQACDSLSPAGFSKRLHTVWLPCVLLLPEYRTSPQSRQNLHHGLLLPFWNTCRDSFSWP